MPQDTTKPDEKLRDLARKLAERLASDDGSRALTRAADATRLRSAQLAEAARVDPKVLQKRITL